MTQHMVTIYRKCGCDEKNKWSMTFGMNAKGVMDDVEFRKYLRGYIVPLSPMLKMRKEREL